MAVHRELDALRLATGANDYLNPLFSECVRYYEKQVRNSRKNQGIVDRLNQWFDGYAIADIDQEDINAFVVENFTRQLDWPSRRSSETLHAFHRPFVTTP